MSQLKSGLVGTLPEAQTTALPSSTPDGWFPNGCPEDGTRFRVRNNATKTARREGRSFIWENRYRDDSVGKVTFCGDKMILGGSFVKASEIVPLDE